MKSTLCSLITSLLAFTCAGLAAAPSPTFTKDVAPILFESCVGCHRQGEVGPFSLITYEDVRKRAKLLAKLTANRTMPPWKPVLGHGEFKEARVLSDAQIAVFQAWFEAGAPQGNATDLPPLPKFPEGWQAGPPDMILKIAKPFPVPAEGDDIYVQFVFPMNLEKDKYVKAVQILPSNRRVAHHGVIMLDDSGTARKLAAKGGSDFYRNFGGPGFMPKGFLPGYAPGMTTRITSTDKPEENLSITLAKGMDIVLQMHYHPVGKESFDEPQIGIYFTEKKPERAGNIILMANNDVDIPAGAKAHKRSDTFKVPVDLEVQSIWGHMHMIGRELRVWANLPDGTKKDMLLINDWDFNWQDTYLYKKPFVLPKGTIVNAEWVWDNTADNPRNPNSPPKRVVWGEGSTDEMTGLIIGGKTVERGLAEGIMWLTVIGHYFDVENRAKEAQRIRTTTGQNPVLPETPATAPQTEMQKWIADLNAQWQTTFKREVTDLHAAELDKLRLQYLNSLLAAITKASDAGDLDGALALRTEHKRFSEVYDMPAEDDVATPSVVTQFRAGWRKQMSQIEKEHAVRAKGFHARYDQILSQAQTQLTQRGRLDDALLVKTNRAEIAAAWITPTIAGATKNPGPPVTSAAPGANPIASRNTSARQPQVTIVSAFYGAGKRTVDISKHLRKVFESGAASIKLDLSNGAEGRDPAPFERKETTITYLINGERKKKTFTEGQDLNFKDELQ